MTNEISQMAALKQYLYVFLKYILPPLFTGGLGWYFKELYDKRTRTRELSILSRGLRAEVLEIKKAALLKADNEYTVIDNHKKEVQNYTYAIINKQKPDEDCFTKYKDFKITTLPNNLDEIYKTKVDKLGEFDELLIIRIKRYYETFRSWKDIHEALINKYIFGLAQDYEAEALYNECKQIAERVIKKSDELDAELASKIKH